MNRLDKATIAAAAGLFAELADDPDDEQLRADFFEGETDLHKLVTRLHDQRLRDEGMVVAIAARQANLADRKARYDKRADTAKRIIGEFMRAADMTRLELPEVTYSVRDGKPGLEVVDRDAVPREFQRATWSPDKQAINEAFADAEALPNWLVRRPAKDVVSGRVK